MILRKKIIHFGGALPFLDGLNLQEILGKKYNVPVGVQNDGKSAALTNSHEGLKDLNAYAGTLGSAVQMVKAINKVLVTKIIK